MDLFDLTDHGEGSLAAALQRFKIERALIIGVETDLLFPIEQQQELRMAHRRQQCNAGSIPCRVTTRFWWIWISFGR
jgi:homoserine acetyltransferase